MPPRHTPETFWQRADRRGPDECWLWIGSTVGGRYCKYGAVGYHGEQWTAHRLAWTLTYGEIPEGMCVCHRCDTPTCINPAHLFLATQLDNIRDMLAKGRVPDSARRSIAASRSAHRGSRHHMAKLNEDQVREIRALAGKLTQRQLSEKFEIAQAVISEIINNKIWTHV